MDPVVLLAIGGVLAVLALYFLFLRQDATMWAFVCIVGLVVVGILYFSPDVLKNGY